MLEGFTKRSALTIILLMVVVLSFFLYATTPQPSIEPRGEGLELWEGMDDWALEKVQELSRSELIDQLIAVKPPADERTSIEPSVGALIGPGHATEEPTVQSITSTSPLRIRGTPWYTSLTGLTDGADAHGSELLTFNTSSTPRLAYGITRHTAKQLRNAGGHSLQVLDISRGDFDLQHGSRILEETLTAASRSRILSQVHVSAESFTEPEFSFRHYIPFIGTPQTVRFPEGLYASIAYGAKILYLEDVQLHSDAGQLIDRIRHSERFDGLIVADINEQTRPDILSDMLTSGASLFATNSPDQLRTNLGEAIDRELISEDDLRHAAKRVLQARAWVHREHTDQDEPVSPVENSAATARLATIVYQSSITLLQDHDNILPLSPETDIFHVELSAGEALSSFVFTSELSRTHPDTLHSTRTVGTDLSSEEIAEIREAAEQSSVTIATIHPDPDEPYRLRASHHELLRSLAASNTRVILVAMGRPELVPDLPANASTIIWHPSQSDEVQQHLVQSLYGAVGFYGSLPRHVSPDWSVGHGMITPPSSPVNAPPEAAGMRPASLNGISFLLESAIGRRAFPGAAVAVGRAQQFVFARGAGTFTYDEEHPVTTTSLFDLASLTKPIATTTAIMQLYERDLIELDDPVSDYLPAFQDGERDDVTIAHLLAHTSGLPSHRFFHLGDIFEPEEIVDQIMREPLQSEPGSRTVYSDLGFITLALIVESVTNQPFADYVSQHIFRPLRMYQTSFRPAGIGPDPMVVPTEDDRSFREMLVQGEVHDETAYLLGGTAGHAGLFSTAEDLALFAHMLVNNGAIHGYQFLQPETIEKFTTRLEAGGSTRALGWDTRSEAGYSSAGQYFGPNSFGHTGFTGTSFWVDPDEELYVILVTNRVHPTRENRLILEIRPQVADLAFQALEGPSEILLPGIYE